MERIRLSKNAKRVFHLLDKGIYQRPYDMNQKEFNVGALELEKHSFAICHCESNGDVIIVKLLTDGKLYIADNPSLQNPFDWKWLIPLAVSIISIILSLIACTKTI